MFEISLAIIVQILLLVPVFGLSHEKCGIANSVSRVFDGQKVEHRKYPWLVHLSILANGEKMGCGGTLISERAVITAAHCVHTVKEVEDEKIHTPIRPEDITIHINPVSLKDRESDSVIRSIETIVTRASYRKNIPGHDIALLIFKNPLNFQKNIAPICLPDSEIEPLEKKKFTVAGWGGTSEVQHGQLVPELFSVNHAREAELDHVIGDRCAYLYSAIVGDEKMNTTYDREREICATGLESMADACSGDSGGPLTWQNPNNGRYYLVGTVSRGPPCPNRLRVPVLYTKVQPFLDDINRLEGSEELIIETVTDGI